MNLTNLVFVDCEARGVSPVRGTMTEFGAVHYLSRTSFHGKLFESSPDPENPAIPLVGKRIHGDAGVARALTLWLQDVCKGRSIMVSDNPAYDYMWIAGLFDSADMINPFGHSARRIGDFWAGLNKNFHYTQTWKRMRQTRHDHNPVNDAMGNVEAFEQMIQMMREGKFGEPNQLA